MPRKIPDETTREDLWLRAPIWGSDWVKPSRFRNRERIWSADEDNLGGLCSPGCWTQDIDALELTVMVEVQESDRTMDFNKYSLDGRFTPVQLAIVFPFCDRSPSVVTTKSVSGV